MIKTARSVDKGRILNRIIAKTDITATLQTCHMVVTIAFGLEF